MSQIIREGWIEKRGGKQAQKDWKRRWLSVSSSGLRYYTKPGGDLKGIIDLKDVQGAASGSYGRRGGVFEVSTPQRLFIFDGFDDAQRREWLTSIKEAKLRRTGKGSGVSAPSTSSHFPFEKEEGGPFARHGAGTGTGSSRATMLVAVSEVRRPWDWGVQEVVGWARTLPLTEVAQEVLLALLEGGHVDGETLVEELITEADWLELGVPSYARSDLHQLVLAADLVRQPPTPQPSTAPLAPAGAGSAQPALKR